MFYTEKKLKLELGNLLEQIWTESCKLNQANCPDGTGTFPGGVLEVYMTGGGPTYFFGLKIYKLGIFLGQEICHIFF